MEKIKEIRNIERSIATKKDNIEKYNNKCDMVHSM